VSTPDIVPPASVQVARAPVVRAITLTDIREALLAGVEDFRAEPRFGIFFGGFYALGGILILACLLWLGLAYLAYPLAAGFALLGPFVAAGLYDVSRRREARAPLLWRGVLGLMLREGGRELSWMAFVGVFLFIVWMYQVRLLLALIFGLRIPPDLDAFLVLLVTTPQGLLFLVIGHVMGAALALVTFSITVVGCPLLLDRDIDVVTAMITSVQAVLRNPGPMLAYATCVAALLVLGMLPFLIGLLIALPVLGHSTWHVYRRVIAPAEPHPA